MSIKKDAYVQTRHEKGNSNREASKKIVEKPHTHKKPNCSYNYVNS